MRTAGTRRIGGSLVALVLLALAAGVAPPAAAQQTDIKPLLDRIDQLERDVNLLQRQVYRGTAPGGTPVPVSPPDGPNALSSEVRIGQLEDEMRTLTGQLEEINYSIDQLKHRLDALSSDVDQRLTALEHPGAAGAGAAGAGAAAAGTAPPPAPPHTPAPPRTAQAGQTPGTANTSGVLGTLGSSGAAGSARTGAPPVSAPVAAEPPQSPAANLPTGTPMEQYQYAFGLLRQAKYGEAEGAFKSFMQRFPNDQLAGSAQYWLGETYYVRQQYKDAATAFAYGYQKYPKSGKGADYLLKLGMSLGSLGQKQDACSAFQRLDRDFPSAPGNIKEHEVSERQELGCP
ncbi:MAG TPA: tol-pal system protein YbgF [Stellaceae bacterium]|nr:tol-pal system protein YbgF [Stellaceae bacterium]